MNCNSCQLPIEEMETWDDAMRGKTLEKEFEGFTADEIFSKLDWQKPPPRPEKSDAPIPQNFHAKELIEKYRKRKRDN